MRHARPVGIAQKLVAHIVGGFQQGDSAIVAARIGNQAARQAAKRLQPPQAFARQIGLTDITSIPLSGLKGDNMLVASEKTPWYHGPTLMGFLETCEVDDTRLQKVEFEATAASKDRPAGNFSVPSIGQ